MIKRPVLERLGFPSPAAQSEQQADHLIELLRREPRPPRRVRFGELLRQVSSAQAGRHALGVCLFAGAALFFWTYAGETIAVRAPLSAFMALGAVFVGAGMLVQYGSYARALRYGIRSRGEVLEVWQVEDRDAAVPEIQGSYCVDHPFGEFTERFRLSCEWAARIRKGDEISVLVDPRRQTVLLNLGVGRPTL